MWQTDSLSNQTSEIFAMASLLFVSVIYLTAPLFLANQVSYDDFIDLKMKFDKFKADSEVYFYF